MELIAKTSNKGRGDEKRERKRRNKMAVKKGNNCVNLVKQLGCERVTPHYLLTSALDLMKS